ncbi:hypothetical protein FVE67_06560 [Thermosulfurimonas marina]|uniref:Uncharacterized protein n=1 Tax=Thermosulfurimonas marina TaxID=2047767 RepID=A0A6H1WTI3_9BACT|nr:DsrE family protein [Thermosulfurimonas marina]QJA06481.1 hypothetical protein FVE67_06560 [Thermosulfurimonas marina]
MRKARLGTLIFVFLVIGLVGGALSSSAAQRGLLIVITTNDQETAWQAFRLANFALSQGDQVKVYLTGKGVEILKAGNEPVDLAQKIENFLRAGGRLYG